MYYITPSEGDEMASKVQDPNNVEIKKGFVFNETGNIMMSTTDLTNEVIEQSVKDVFAEVSVFFAAMTKSLEKNADESLKGINKKTGNSFNFSLYDYDALKKIIDGSGCFCQVTEEDVDIVSSSWGATFSKELVEDLLGLATGTGELAFAQALASSVGKAGVAINGSKNSTSKKVANIIFVCEYLLGMPIISAIVATADAKTAAQQFNLGPCIKEQSEQTKFTFHKDTYMFVTPAFIKEYSGDIVNGMDDPEFEILTKKFTNLLKE